MKPQSLLVGVVSLFVVVGGWLVWRSGEDIAPSLPTGASNLGDKAVPAAAAAAADVATAALATGASPTAGSTADGAAERLPVAPIPGGGDAAPCTVRGRLVDLVGAARADVEVHWSSWGIGGDLGGIAIPGPLGERVERPEDKVRTDRDGRFHFAIGKNREGSLELDVTHFVFRNGECRFSTRNGDADLGDVVVVAPARVRGSVVDAVGQPVADVAVTAGSGLAIGMGLRSTSKTDAQGRFEIDALHAGKWTLRTMSSRFLPATLAVELGDEEQKDGVRLTVEQGQSIAGQVVDDRGMAVAGARVGAMRSERSGGVSIERLASGESATTDAGGFFVLGGLTGANATVQASADGHQGAREANVAIGTGDLVLRMPRCGAITGVLRDTNGAPIAGSRVVAEVAGRGARGLGGVDMDIEGLPGVGLPGARGRAVTAADGTFRIENVDPGAVVVRARGKTHRPTERGGLVVQPAQVVEGVMLTAEIGAIVAATVVDDDGKPVADAKVEVREPAPANAESGGGTVRRSVRVGTDGDHTVTFGDGPVRLGDGTTDEHGSATIAGLPSGAATVLCSHAALADAEPQSIVLPAQGKVEVRLALRRPGAANLHVTRAGGDGAPANYVVHGPLGSPDAERDHSGAAAADGTARIDRLPAGDYWAELRLAPQAHQLGDPGGAMIMVGGEARPLARTRVPFHVDAGRDAEVALRLPTLTRIHGTVTGADGPAADIAIGLAEVAGANGEAGPPGFDGQQVRSGADGTYELVDVQAGRYRLTWGKSDQVVKASAIVDVPPDEPELQRDLELRSGKVRLVVVRSEDGEPIEGAEVELVEGGAPGAAPRRQQRMVMISMSADGGGGAETTSMTIGAPRAKSDVDGLVEIADVPPGRYTVRVRHDRFAGRDLADQTVVERTTTDCGRVQMDLAGRIRGRVVAADGSAVPMALVTCSKVGGDGEPERQPAMGGSFSFGGLAAGKYALRAQPIGGDDNRFGDPVEVEVKAGKSGNDVELRLPR